MSSYCGGMIKTETGKSAQEYIQIKLIGVAKDLVADSDKTFSLSAYE